MAYRSNPIMQMSFLYYDGVPMAYKLFPGNNNYYTALVPFIRDIHRKYCICKMVVVEEKVMKTSRLALRNQFARIPCR